MDKVDGLVSGLIQPHVETVTDLVFVDHSIGTQHKVFSMNVDDSIP
jgi:hypothetical protein